MERVSVQHDSNETCDPEIAAILPDLHAAHAHHQAGRLDQAEALYEKVLAAVPDLGDPLHLLGQITLTRGQYERAVELISRAIEDLPEDVAEPHLNLGNAYVGLRNPHRAEAGYRRAIAIEPSLAVAHANLARILNLTGRHEEAIAASRQALS